MNSQIESYEQDYQQIIQKIDDSIQEASNYKGGTLQLMFYREQEDYAQDYRTRYRGM